jgi:AcrR family transcriptional regulator
MLHPCKGTVQTVGMSEPGGDLLAAVERALERHGLPGLTLEHIAEEAGLNRVTLYRRGHRREDLLRYAATAAATEFRDSALPALTHRGSARERLTMLVEALCDLADEHLGLLAALYDGPTAAFHLALDDADVLTRFEYTEPFERILADGVADGTLASDDPHEDAEVMFNVVGWTYVHLRRSHGWSSRRARDALLRRLF